jgi:hypothetical protein
MPSRNVYESGWKVPPNIHKVFSAQLASAIIDAKVDHTERSFEQFALSLATVIVPHKILAEFPTNTKHLMHILGPLLHDECQALILTNCHEFNVLVGTPVADGFVTHLTCYEWFKTLAAVTVRHSIHDPLVTLTASDSPPEKDYFTLDGTSDEAVSKLTQVVLKGPNILEAWKNNTTIIDKDMKQTLSDLEKQARMPSTWSPREAGGLPVFHGTSTHFKYPYWPDRWNQDVGTLHPASTIGGQMGCIGVPLVYTAFSPIRAFLWAAFKEHIYSNIPTKSEITLLERQWSSGSRTYSGIVVFYHTASQPHSADLSSFVIPEGRQRDWHNTMISNSNSGKISPQMAWKSVAHIHRSTDLDTWPGLVHGLEFGEQRSALDPFRINMWRTVWLGGAAVEKLNQNYIGTIAITFELEKESVKAQITPVTSVKPSKKKKNDDDRKDHNKGRFACLKKSFSKMSLRHGKRDGTA